MSEVNKLLSCANCNLREHLLVFCLPCSTHALCTDCREKIRIHVNLNVCPYCKTSGSSSSQDLHSLRSCSLCKINLEEANIQFCRECNTKFCFNCSIAHKRDDSTRMHTFDSPFAVEKPQCSKHNKEAEYFCIDNNCREVLCFECLKISHVGHNKSRINDPTEELRDKVLEMIKSYDDKFHQVDYLLSMLNWRKHAVEASANEIESELTKIREDSSQEVKMELDIQIQRLYEKRNVFIGEISDEIIKLRKLRANLQILKEQSVHYSAESLNYNVLRDFYAFEFIAGTVIPTEVYSMQFKTLVLTKSKYADCDVKLVVGVVNTAIDEDAILKVMRNQENVFRASFLYETDCNSIKDICYDLEHKYMYLVEVRGPLYFIIRISESNDKKVLRLNFGVQFSPDLQISLIPENKILLRTSTKFKLISTDLTRVDDFNSQWQNHLLMMCSSRCKTCSYYLCSDGGIYGYNHINKLPATASISFANECQQMSVSINLDYIVFTGYFRKIKIFSLKQQKELNVLSSSGTSIYKNAAFLSDNILVAYEFTKSCLEIFNIKKEEMVRRITDFEGQNLQNFGRICLLTVGSPGIFYVQTELQRKCIYKVIY